MYAIMETGGKQYKVAPGDIIRVEKLPGNKDDEVLFDKVLLISDKEKIELGHPFIKDAKVRGKILNQGRSKKVVVFKFRRRKRYHKKRGHRQYLTTVKIENIEL
ncbi:Ribosomal protein L21 [Candidatus Desulfofervidus auxilii]|uniref:Large ribosomal subunit protein bL21 n=1 Tax=Desulfofervidus auxilii TaxID=1621989 RepID=A0A7U4TG45_DESA2|nr:50S ribosomal protein L21 [Candidatus Desulfofervidus auxilii]AMM40094.1 Ribosomal protein L21 [Candidatus Desulfofervidus auxilii]CAD7771355.1 50S ribosomal protein L21 [Candidatus Methanoperedenaceae archaeon GB37]CAD7780158.1 MAG: 50S ribosomal protein L21 [Candidatus Methanoperedenaceae archaeon GB37]